ncbi:MAG: sialidase family protein [Gammaproteobacteria bacterium]|nr:sialidase family protein [Gammaproteobacteria bacterium]
MPLLAAWLGLCSPVAAGVAAPLALLEAPPLPLPGEHAVPALTPSPLGPILSWLAPTPDNAFLIRYAALHDDGWDAAATVATERTPWLSPADPPRVHAFPDGTLVAHWARKNGDGPYAYVTLLSVKRPGGTWRPPLPLHEDSRPVQHGLPTALLETPDRMRFLWLDARGESAGLRERSLDSLGRLGIDREVDPMTCSCCRIALAALPGGDLLAAYRDRTGEEIRDIRLLRRTAADDWRPTGWQSGDGWEIAGCPVNGPALATRDAEVALAWFTAADDRPRLRLARSDDGGRTFAAPVRFDEGDPIGRPALAHDADGRLVVAWLERTPSGPRVRVRVVSGSDLSPAMDAGAAPGRFDSHLALMPDRDGLLLFVAGAETARLVRLGTRP